MFLSRIPLNPVRRGTQKFLASPQVTHAAVLASFPPDSLDQPGRQGRVLWRIDHDHPRLELYVVSPTEPDFTHIIEQAGWPTTTSWSTRKYAELLDRLEEDQRWHFRLTANPVANTPVYSDEPGAKKPRGKRRGLTAAEQLEWVVRKGADNGFTVPPCGPSDAREADVAIIDRCGFSFQRGARTVSLSTVTFEGTLTVTDPELLRTALISGLGRAKGYGCGLMTLAPPR